MTGGGVSRPTRFDNISWFWTCDPEKRNDYELYLFFLNAYPYRSYFGRMHTDTITGNAKVRVVRKYQDK